MKIKLFEWADYEESTFNEIKGSLPLENLEIEFTKEKFNIDTAKNIEVISIFVDSRISNEDLEVLKLNGVHTILLRAAGFNMLNVEKAKELGIKVLRVTNYSPESVAEHVFALLLALVRHLMVDRRKHISLQDGREASQVGMVLRGKTIGVYGFGHIGSMVGNIAKHGFGMNVIYFDQYSKHTDSNFTPVNSLEELFLKSDIVSIHVSLSEETKCIIDKKYLNLKKNLILINTARGGIVNTVDCLEALQNGNLSGIGFDVVRNDDSYKNFPIQDNIVFTQHTAFMTKEAIAEIMRQTFGNIYGLKPENRVV